MITEKKYHFAVTGGHHNSALVVAQSLVKMGHHVDWIGHKTASRNDQNESAEYLEVTACSIPFHNLIAGKFTIHNGFINLFNIPAGIYRAYSLLKKLRSSAVISFGGYLGVATCVAAYLQGIPVYLHEQTVTAGLANKFVALFAKKIFLTWESSLAKFPSQKSVLVGLPLRASILNGHKIKMFSNQLPTLLVMGGKQGSHVINNLIFKHLPEILESYNLFHQTGTSSVTADYEKALALQTTLPESLVSHYAPLGYIGEGEIGNILHSADLYIGRSGAHISYELGLLGKPSVLIPYLLTHEQEQLLNARMLVEHGVGLIIGESELSYPKLREAIREGLRLNPHKLELEKHAELKIIEQILTHLET